MMQQIYIDGVLADIGDNTEVTLTIKSNLLTGAADFVGNNSLTINLPSTVHNRTLFGNADIVQGGGAVPYQFHVLDYYRDGVQIIRGGLCRLMSATPAELQVAVVWGVRTAVDALLTSNNTLNDITTDAAIEFHAQPQVSTYADALTDEVFYAALDTIHHGDEGEYFRAHVVLNDKSWDVSDLSAASSFLHPSVRMNWLQSKLETMFGMTFDFGAAQDDIDTMIVPLISKIPNDITFNGGYKSSLSEPSWWGTMTGNFINIKTVNNSAIITEEDTDPAAGHITCETAFSGMIKYNIVFYIDKADLRTIAYPVYGAKYGYRLDVTAGSTMRSVTFMPENTAILPNDINSANRVYIYVTGYLPVKLEVGEWLTVRVTCISNGVGDILLPNDGNPGIHVQGGSMYISEIVGTLNEVQPTQQYPVEGNLPKIKPVDLLKFLCVMTGTFPVQSSTADVLTLRPVGDVFDYSRAVDWSARLLSPTDRAVATEKAYHPDGWARNNWWRWKEDDTVSGDYDGSIAVDDETIDENRDIFVLPFAATDGNNVPMYTSEVKWNNDLNDYEVKIKWAKVEPRVLRLVEDDSHNAVGDFDLDMANVINTHYADLMATMLHPVIITEVVRMDDVTFASVDETRPIYLAQHGAYFAMLSCELHQNGTAKVKLLKLKKQEEV